MFGGQKNRIDLNLAVQLAKNRKKAKADLKANRLLEDLETRLFECKYIVLFYSECNAKT